MMALTEKTMTKTTIKMLRNVRPCQKQYHLCEASMIPVGKFNTNQFTLYIIVNTDFSGSSNENLKTEFIHINLAVQ